MVRWLLERGVDVHETQGDGATALMAAVHCGADEAMAAILAARADIDHRSDGGWTALMLAGQGGRIDAARRLLDAGAQMDVANADGATVRSLAQVAGHSEFVKLLDTRAKLRARREKKAKVGTGGEAEGGDGVAPGGDDRDLEALLADLGEKQGAARKKKAGKAAPKAKPAQCATQQAEPEEVAAAEPAPAVAAAAPEPPRGGQKQRPLVGKVAEPSRQPLEQAAHAGVAEAEEPRDKPPPQSAKAAPETKERNGKGKAKAEDRAGKVAVLRARLEELRRMQAEIDAERAEIEQQLLTALDA